MKLPLNLKDKLELINEPTKEDFIPGEMYCVNVFWSFYQDLDQTYDLSVEIPAYTPFMFIGSTNTTFYDFILNVDKQAEIMEILVRGNCLAYYEFDMVVESLNSERSSLYKINL